MKATNWQPNHRIQISRFGRRSDRTHLRTGGYTTDRHPEKIDSLIKIEVKLDDGDLVWLPVHLIQNIPA